jgi:ankyrin repeat protein
MNLGKVGIILSLIVACCLVHIGESNGQGRNPRQERLCKQLFEAIKSGNQDRVKAALDQGADVNCLGGDVYPLPYAAHHRHLPIVKLLLSRGAKINLGYEGEDALLFAVSHGDLPMVRYLLAQGADPKLMESELNGTLLMNAARGGHLEIAKLLVQHGVDINLQTLDRETALNIAQKKGHTAIVEFLKKSGAKR